MSTPRPSFAGLLSRLVGVLACGLALSGQALAVDPDKAFHHFVRDAWSIEEGLPQVSALAIAQDKQGYVWVGTQAGLARFDGVRFTAYRPESTSGLPGLWIRDLLPTSDGRLWIASYRGLGVHEAGRFRMVNASAEHTEALPDVLALALGADQQVYASHSAGVSVAEGDTLVLRHPLPRPAHALLAGEDGFIVGSRGGLYWIASGQDPRFEALPEDAESATVTRLVRDGETLWAGTNAGLFKREGTGTWQRFDGDADLARAPIEALYRDAAGQLWVATVAHLARLQHGQVREWVRERPIGLSVRALAEDHEGNLWVGSQWAGLIRVRNGWTRRYASAEGLHDPLVWSVARDDDGRTWVGTSDGLAVFNGQRFEQRLSGGALPHANAYTLLPERGQLWIGTRGGLVRMEADGRVAVPPGMDALDGTQINALQRSTDGRLWIANSRGLAVEDQPGQGIRPVHRAGGGPAPIARLLQTDRDGRLMVGTQGGLFVVEDDALQPVGRDRGLDDTMDITAMHRLSDGRLVLGTLDERLVIEDHKGHWHRLGVDRGLPVNSAFFITDAGSYLWVAGLRGIYRVSLADLDAAVADPRHRVSGDMLLNERGDRHGGQKGFCCNGAGLAKGFLADGQLWLPTRDGVVTLDTGRIAQNALPPSVVVERVRVRDAWRDVLDQGDTELALGAEDRDLDLEFTALSFQAPASVDLKVRLAGYDTDWRPIDDSTKRSVRYTNLPPGSYVFEVLGANNDGVWTPEPTRLRFRIAPHFHETLGFKLMLIALLAMMIFAGYRIQLHRHRRQRLALESLVRRRTEDLEEANQRLHEASLTDPLTGLRNRRYLAAQIPADIAFYDREQGQDPTNDEVMVFALIDIDHFKRINDVHGHHAGDAVLQQFARRLEGLVRSGDYIARWGGEEFLLVFRPLPRKHLPTLGERVRRRIADTPFDLGDGKQALVTCSIGLVEYPLFPGIRGVPGWEQMIVLADRALYRVKAVGRNGWATWRHTADADPTDSARRLRENPGLEPSEVHLTLLHSETAAPDDKPAAGE